MIDSLFIFIHRHSSSFLLGSAPVAPTLLRLSSALTFHSSSFFVSYGLYVLHHEAPLPIPVPVGSTQHKLDNAGAWTWTWTCEWETGSMISGQD